jgi:cytochrome c oxidase subunit II
MTAVTNFVGAATPQFASASLFVVRVHGMLLFDEPPNQSILHPVSPQGHAIDWLYWVIFWICFTVFVLMVFFLMRGASRAYLGGKPPMEIINNEEADQAASWWVGGAVGVTVISLFVVLFMSVSTGRRAYTVQAQNAVTIKVTGHQWWWEATYENSEADLTITTANELHVPTGQTIAIVGTSDDVIHSFWVPNVAGKRDLLPGYQSAFSFQIDKPGIYRGQCAEFCGLQHAHMGLEIVAEDPDEFAVWQQQQLQAAAEPSTPEAARGRDVFLSHACVMCHTIRGTTAGSRMGPDLTHIASRNGIAAEMLPNNYGNLAGWILDPQGIKPGSHMAPNTLSGAELQDLLTYLSTLK